MAEPPSPSPPTQQPGPVLRKLLIAILAVPVLAGVYAGSVLGRSRVIRGGVAIALGAIVALGAISFARPAATTASPVSDIAPLTQAAFRMAVATNIDLRAPASILFTTPMQRESVASSVSIQPAVPFDLAWSADDTSVTIVPTANWAPSTYYTVTVGAGALATSGRPMTTPARTAFLTRDAATASLGATSMLEKRITIDSGFTVSFDQAVDLSSVGPAIRLDPPLTGALTRTSGPNDASTYTFVPSSPLAPDTKYRMIVDGVRDTAGIEIAPITVALRTVAAPEVVRFRPRAGIKDVLREATISVRFSKAMDRASAKKALSVTANGKRVTGTVTFAEGDKVLVFDPTSKLPYGASVVATVGPTARSADEVPLGVTKKATFTVVPKPAATKQSTTTRTTTRQIPRDGGGGGSVGGGSWGAVERYYLKLMNCTRTGGWVTSGGDCSSPGGRAVAPLKLDTGISAKVSRPYAKKLAVNNMCTHFSGGNPGDRLRRAGYTSYRWAENLGCRSGNPYSAVLGTHRFYQSEVDWRPQGGHYVNLMNPKYDRAGIGVWVSGGRVRLVVDFYHP